jgi:hypothetical protein
MAGNKITLDELTNEMNAAITAFRAGDLVTAYTHARAAQMMLAVKPDTSFSDEELTYDREAIGQFLKNVEKLQRSASQASSKITHIPVRSRLSYTGFDDSCTN